MQILECLSLLLCSLKSNSLARTRVWRKERGDVFSWMCSSRGVPRVRFAEANLVSPEPARVRPRGLVHQERCLENSVGAHDEGRRGGRSCHNYEPLQKKVRLKISYLKNS